MISIVVAYFEREKQLLRTLESFKQYDPGDFNVVIVDNGSKEDLILPKLPYEVKQVKLTGMPGHCVFTYNAGFLESLDSDIIIMQGAECCHQGNVIEYAKRVTDSTYISFGCYSLSEKETPETVVINNRCQTFDGDSAWYNHPVYNGRGLNFCSAITTKNIIKLNGFDERFGYGCAYEDDYLLHQISMLGLTVEITADPFVFHQWHPMMGNRSEESWEKNLNLFNELSQSKEFRSKHILTLDL